MGWRDVHLLQKNNAQENNYKIDYFNEISSNAEIASMSAIKKYFNTLYEIDGMQSTSFTVGQSMDDVYVSEEHNKINRLCDYRNMSLFHEVGSSIDMMCYSANIPDENNNLISVKIVDPFLDVRDIARIKDCIQEYLDLFDFENNFEEYFRTLIIEGQLCWENIIAKDDLESGIIGINIIPNDAYEFCYDVKERRKIGIMITNTLADNFYISNVIGRSFY